MAEDRAKVYSARLRGTDYTEDCDFVVSVDIDGKFIVTELGISTSHPPSISFDSRDARMLASLIKTGANVLDDYNSTKHSKEFGDG